jgi:hypothetical protein
MNNSVMPYSTKNVSEALVKEITTAIKTVQDYGSVELFVQDGVVTQITTRTIKKTIDKSKERK